METGETKTNLQYLFDRSTLLHLRIPFSFYLLPVFCFGLSQAPVIDVHNTAIVFIALHLFIYPGSNSYNSYMDQDTGSIGGLKSPPPASRGVYLASIIADVLGLMICALSGWRIVLLMCGYVAFSKAYSWHGIRLKKMPLPGWLAVAFFQGGYTFMIANMAACNNVSLSWFNVQHIEAMLFATLIIGGSYPLTQIYQHEEDGQRGDHTISYRLGIMGTFLFSSIFFLTGTIVLYHYMASFFTIGPFLIYLISTTPVLLYFSYWIYITARNPAMADYGHAMLMNKISSTCMIVCFCIILWVAHPTLT